MGRSRKGTRFARPGVSHKAAGVGLAMARSPTRAVAASYNAADDLIEVRLGNGSRFAFPPRLAQGLAGATAKQLAEVTILPPGNGLHWETLDADLLVDQLLAGAFGSKVWMRELARRGGSVTSESKARAARRNGRKGGRPRTRRK